MNTTLVLLPEQKKKILVPKSEQAASSALPGGLLFNGRVQSVIEITLRECAGHEDRPLGPYRHTHFAA
jgi:hypothetical protein